MLQTFYGHKYIELRCHHIPFTKSNTESVIINHSSMLKTVIVVVSMFVSHPLSIHDALGWVCQTIRGCVPDLSTNQRLCSWLLTNQRLCFWLGMHVEALISNALCNRVTYNYRGLLVGNILIFSKSAGGWNFRGRKVKLNMRNKNMVVTQYLWCHLTLIMLHSGAAESHVTPYR